MVLTIFTPTFNRADTLKRLYESLKAQEFKDFEWLIIDDGSTDNTAEIVQEFISESRINIRYVYQANSGKQSAWNNAVMIAEGNYFCGVDSDDTLYTTLNLKIILENYLSVLQESGDVVAIRCPSINSRTNELDGKLLSGSNVVLSFIDEFNDKDYFGERIDIFKIKYLRLRMYPINSEIKFIPELWLYLKTIEDNVKFLYIPISLRFFYDESNVNRLSRQNFKKHAQGHKIVINEMFKIIPLRCLLLKRPDMLIKSIIKYILIAFK